MQEMNRRDYIRSLDRLRDDVAEIGKRYANAVLADPNEIEKERIKKTAKLFGDLALRLYEDAAVCLKVCEELEADGIGEQGLFDLREADELPAEGQPLQPKKTGKGKKGGAK